MGLIEGIIGPVAGLLDKIIPDPKARDAAKLELLKLRAGRRWSAVRTPAVGDRRRGAIEPIRGPAARGPASST